MEFKRYRNWNIQCKVMAIPLVALIATMIGVQCLVIPLLGSRIMDGRKAATRKSVEVAYGFIAGYDQEVKAGRMPLAMAQTAAANAIRSLRYGGKEYFWVNDLTPRMVVHPTKPELDGKDLTDFRLADLKTPTLVVWGSVDQLIPISTGEQMHQEIPKSEFAAIPGCGHLAPGECPQPVLKTTIDFLKSGQ